MLFPICKGSIVLKPIRTESIVLKLIYVKRALVREYAPIVEGASYLLQRLDSKVFNMDAWSSVDGFATLLLNKSISRLTYPFASVGL